MDFLVLKTGGLGLSLTLVASLSIISWLLGYCCFSLREFGLCLHILSTIKLDQLRFLNCSLGMRMPLAILLLVEANSSYVQKL